MLGLYGIEDIEDNLRIYSFSISYNIMERAIIDAFYENYPDACLADIPHIEYAKGSDTMLIENKEYTVTKELQEYLADIEHQLETKPMKKVKPRPVDLYLIFPVEEDDQQVPGEIGIQQWLEPVEWENPKETHE